MEISERVKQFIKDCTKSCSNVVYYHNRNFTHGTDYVEGSGIEVQYSPWLTPEQALRAVEIEREEMIDKAIKWLGDNIDRYLYNTGGYGEYIPKCGGKMFEDFKKAMEE